MAATRLSKSLLTPFACRQVLLFVHQDKVRHENFIKDSCFWWLRQIIYGYEHHWLQWWPPGGLERLCRHWWHIPWTSSSTPSPQRTSGCQCCCGSFYKPWTPHATKCCNPVGLNLGSVVARSSLARISCSPPSRSAQCRLCGLVHHLAGTHRMLFLTSWWSWWSSGAPCSSRYPSSQPQIACTLSGTTQVASCLQWKPRRPTSSQRPDV